ncbi:glycosyltransferase family 4 protein [Anditalea andensis]|uniref:Glycosyl transferase family 1 n=1 Tax=Anditalea andensis TaxID=1048983 RepID=A0A074L469_9BACT|nr:glycosyltransferase family 4 protein [Anditalea andensis]KEO74608.1 hypothetical protein EL17_02735 [Anditalea andensis]
MIRVLHCIETISSGGVEQVRLQYAKCFNSDEFQLAIVCTQAKGYIFTAFQDLNIKVVPLGTFDHPFELKIYRKLLEFIREYNPHIIHGAVFEGMSMAVIGKIFGRVPVAILEETSDPQFRSRKANLLLKLYAMIADVVLGISPEVMLYLNHKIKVSDNKTLLMPNGLAIPPFSTLNELSNLRIRLGIAPDDIVIGSVGRMHNEIKRFSDLIDAIDLLSVPSVKCILIGDGPDLNKLKGQVSSLGLNGRILFLGYQSNPHPFYGIMDIFCIPSVQEGFGLVAVEAMFHKLPVIACRVGGLKDIVEGGITGCFVKPKNPLALAEKVKLLVQNPELRYEMGLAGYKKAIQSYTIDIYKEKLEMLYKTLLGK